jgi:GNAT superfamily N-acetyltransferase
MYTIVAKSNAINNSLQPQPDFTVLDSKNEIVCGLWVSGPTGIIGHFKVTDSTLISSLLDFCIQFFASKGCQSVLGPMNGNTWYSYRFVSWSADQPTFFLEPYQPANILRAWQDFGFEIDQTYISSEQVISEVNENKYSLDSQFKFSYIDLNHFEEELARLYRISIEAFADNVYYSDISKEGFFALYLPLKDKIQNKNMLLIKDKEGEIAGYLFGIPDFLQKNPDTYIIKTLAVSPKYRSQHLGSYLVNQCLCEAYKSGYKKIIHALMHESNNSTKIGKGFEVIRRYVLLRKNL